MYDNAVKITSSNVNTSITLIGITLLCKIRGHTTDASRNFYLENTL